jgi:RNA polymerase sigma factor (sigma-70 family)
MQHNDAPLVEQVLAGEKVAFGPLVEHHQPGALRLARRLLGTPADAADVVQEALLQAFLGLRTLRDPAHFGTWLLGIVVNLCRMHIRAQRDGYAWDDGSGGRLPPGLSWADMQPSPEALYEVQEWHRLVLAAIGTLPRPQQDAVRLYYFDGLTLRDLSLLAGVPLGTVKARLHRARTRLRQILGQAHPDGQPTVLDPDEALRMVAVTVHDVMVHVAKDDVGKPEKSLQWHTLKKHGTMMVVLLKEHEGERILPIWVGLGEGSALALHLAEVPTPRPMTYELMAKLLEVGALFIEKVAVTRLHEEVFYAALWVRAGTRMYEIDARPSDAINLALRLRVPIFVNSEVFARCSLTPEHVLSEAEAQYQSATHTGADTEMALRSFRALL